MTDKYIPASKLLALQRYDYESRGYMGFNVWQSVSDGKGEYVRTEDMLAVVNSNEHLLSEISEQKLMGSEIFQAAANHYESIISELIKALEDDAHAASFQSVAGYRTALIAKVKGVVG